MLSVPDQFDGLEVGILVHDPETGEIRYVNEFATELYGYNKAELVGMDIVEISSASFSQAEAHQRIRAAADGEPQRFEWRNRRSTGELYWVEVRLSEITIQGTSYVVALVRDISEYKLNLRHLRVLARITRHNLRNKLNAIDGFFDQLDIDDAGSNSEVVGRIRRNINGLLNLTNWIDTVKSATKVAPSAKTRNICQLVADIGKTYRREYPTITWQFDCEETYATADSTLRTAIDELIDNAVTHNPHEELAITVSVTERPDDGQVRICIEDTGRPIPEVEVEPIVGGYEPDPLEHGDGIGLWEVQTIVNAHGGRLSIAANSVERTAVEIVLPEQRG